MKKPFSMMMQAVVPVLLITMLLTSAAPQKEEVMTKEDGMFVVNTTTLGKDVVGYLDTTPLKIYIKKDKVVKIEALKNQETPKYFAKVKRELLNLWDGKKVSEAATMKVDAVTGATFSSEAVVKNVQLGLEYYRQHKK